MHVAVFFGLLFAGIVFIEAQKDGNDAKDYFCNDSLGVLEPNKEKLDECFKEKANTEEIATFIKECNPGLATPLTVENMRQYHCDISVEKADKEINCEYERFFTIDNITDDTIYGLHSAVKVCLESCCGIKDSGRDYENPS